MWMMLVIVLLVIKRRIIVVVGVVVIGGRERTDPHPSGEGRGTGGRGAVARMKVWVENRPTSLKRGEGRAWGQPSRLE